MRFWSIAGQVSYDRVRELQLSLVNSRAKDEIPDTILFLEHRPVITRGRGLQFTGAPRPRHMPLIQQLPPPIEFCESERGGDLTYHGPGQLVIYPICKLDGSGFAPKHDVGGWIRGIESVLIEYLATLGLTAGVQAHATGVWMGEKKVASLGIAVKKWVTYHGAALNCVNDLNPFHLISPCGFNPEVMTRLADWVQLSTNWRAEVETGLAALFARNAGDMNPAIESIDLNYLRYSINTGAPVGS